MDNHADISVVDSPVGPITIEHCNNRLIGVCYGKTRQARRKQAALPRVIRSQINAYFKNAQNKFDLPLDLQGTAFQKKVWRILQSIPAGKTLTYGEVARRLNSSPRAVGNACRANPVPLVVPCHRVVSAQGIGGFSGQTGGPKVAIKTWLLQHEGAL